MNDRVFVDTNILVYSRDASEPEKQQQAMAWMAHLWSSQSGRLSFQVLNEYYVTVTQKLKPGLDRQKTRDDIRAFLTWKPQVMDENVLQSAWLIQDRFHFSWWDALIVSAAQMSGCRYLLTEDLQEDQILGDVQVINPFSHTHQSLGL